MSEPRPQDDEVEVPGGVLAVYIYDGRVIAHAADFSKIRPAGFTTIEAQRHRAKAHLAHEVVRALASQALHEGLDTYECERIMDRMKGRVQLISIGKGISDD